MRKWVSEIVTINEVQSWEEGDVITIEAGTGQGKSHFIKTHLYAHAKKNGKKILFLIHRKQCVDQFNMEIEEAKKTDVIDIRTYQSIEAKMRRGGKFDFSPYSYCCMDEFHYFMGDAPFNHYTDLSLNAILEQSEITKIFMSATGDYVKRYINAIKKIKTKDYKIPVNYNFIRGLQFYNNDETLVDLIEEAIDKKRKTIFFIQSTNKGFNLYQKYQEHCLFNCGKSDKNYVHVDEEKIQLMLKNERFEELILITSTVMDAGVNIKDDELNHVIADVQDVHTLIQCIGRKRIMKEGDHIYLCIKTINNNQLGGLQTQIEKKMEMADFLRKNTVEEYIKKYPRTYDKWNLVYDDVIEGEENKSTKKVNDLMYFKCLVDHNLMSAMKFLDDFGYCKWLARFFNFYDGINDYYEYTTVEYEKKKMSLKEYLYSVNGKKLFKDEQKELINKIDLRVNGRQQKSYKKLNEGLHMLRFPFVIIKNIDNRRKLENGSDNPNKDKTYWVVIESLT